MPISRVLFHPKRVAAALPFDPAAAMISISTPGLPVFLPQRWDPILRLEFHDDDGEDPDAPWILFDEDMARSVIDFIDSVAATRDTLHVHCTAGVSRSAAVARFACERLSLPFPEGYVMDNKHVGRVLRLVAHGPTDFQSVFCS